MVVVLVVRQLISMNSSPAISPKNTLVFDFRLVCIAEKIRVGKKTVPFLQLHLSCRQVFTATLNGYSDNRVHFVITMPEQVIRSRKKICA